MAGQLFLVAVVAVVITVPKAAPSAAVDCRTVNSQSDVAISTLHPTQPNVGLGEVEKKRKGLADADPDHGSLDDGEPVPVVVGPDGELYLTDHHHFVLALLLAKGEKALVRITVLENGSCQSCTPSNDTCVHEFWEHMTKDHLTYLCSDDDKPMRYTSLPRSFAPDASPKLQNDPYRTLVNVMRKKPPTGQTEPCLVRPEDPRTAYFWEFRMAEMIRRRIHKHDADDLIQNYAETTKISQNLMDAACSAWNEEHRNPGAKTCAETIADDPSLVD